jgi:hypothetical protein
LRQCFGHHFSLPGDSFGSTEVFPAAFYRRRPQQMVHVDRPLQQFADTIHYLHGEQGMAAEIEEVVVNAHLPNA